LIKVLAQNELIDNFLKINSFLSTRLLKMYTRFDCMELILSGSTVAQNRIIPIGAFAQYELRARSI
jgi:hypothetical protein